MIAMGIFLGSIHFFQINIFLKRIQYILRCIIHNTSIYTSLDENLPNVLEFCFTPDFVVCLFMFFPIWQSPRKGKERAGSLTYCVLTFVCRVVLSVFQCRLLLVTWVHL